MWVGGLPYAEAEAIGGGDQFAVAVGLGKDVIAIVIRTRGGRIAPRGGSGDVAARVLEIIDGGVLRRLAIGRENPACNIRGHRLARQEGQREDDAGD